MTDPLRPALAAYLAVNEVKLVHVWQTLDRWNAMVEWPYDPTKPKLPTERHATGVADDMCSAVIAGCDRIGFGGLAIRLYVLSRLIDIPSAAPGRSPRQVTP